MFENLVCQCCKLCFKMISPIIITDDTKKFKPNVCLSQITFNFLVKKRNVQQMA